jgi:hypothetical protein
MPSQKSITLLHLCKLCNIVIEISGPQSEYSANLMLNDFLRLQKLFVSYSSSFSGIATVGTIEINAAVASVI